MNDQTEEKLKEFYRESLLPVAERQGDFFPLGPDAAAKSYYVERADSGDYIHEIDANDLEGELRSMWSGDLPELAEIAGELMELAELLQEKEETADEVSPFIYAMF